MWTMRTKLRNYSYVRRTQIGDALKKTKLAINGSRRVFLRRTTFAYLQPREQFFTAAREYSQNRSLWLALRLWNTYLRRYIFRIVVEFRNSALSGDIFAKCLDQNIKTAIKLESRECWFSEWADHVYRFCDFWRNSGVVKTSAAARTMFHVFCSTLFDNEMRYCSFVGLFTCSTLVAFRALRRCFLRGEKRQGWSILFSVLTR